MLRRRSFRQTLLRVSVAGVSVAAAGMLAGCAAVLGGGSQPVLSEAWGEQRAEIRLRAGDQIQVRLDPGVSVAPQGPQLLEMVIDENGEISLPLIGRVVAQGLTPSELAERIQAHYVPRYYVRCNVNVLVAVRYFYVSGEVRAPGRYVWSEDVTLLRSISTAGGFTDYANRRSVELVRGGERHVFNCEQLQRDPSLDVPLRPGDQVLVRRSIF
jgi:protein involved in polysaccharide export with SLBB domain